jgi:hypothetical protein
MSGNLYSANPRRAKVPSAVSPDGCVARRARTLALLTDLKTAGRSPARDRPAKRSSHYNPKEKEL